MATWKEIERFNHDELTYIVAYELFDSFLGKIPFLMFFVTTKTGKKIRDKKCVNKVENHFSLLKKVNNPIRLYRKISNMYYNFLKKYNYVCFKPHEDSSKSRLNVYRNFLESIDFKYIFSVGWYYFYSKDNINIKRKNITKLKKMYDEYH